MKSLLSSGDLWLPLLKTEHFITRGKDGCQDVNDIEALKKRLKWIDDGGDSTASNFSLPFSLVILDECKTMCVRLRHDGQLHDRNCSKKYRFLCKGKILLRISCNSGTDELALLSKEIHKMIEHNIFNDSLFKSMNKFSIFIGLISISFFIIDIICVTLYYESELK